MVLGKNQNITISFKIFIYKSRNIYVQKRKIHFVRELSPSTFRSLYHERQKKFFTIIGPCWAKYHDLSVASSRRLRQIIDLWDTDKSWHFTITEFNNCFFIWSSSLFFNEYLREANRSQEGEKHVFIYAWAEYYLQPHTLARYSAWAVIICRHLFAGHVMDFRPMKREKILHKMITLCVDFILLSQIAYCVSTKSYLV